METELLELEETTGVELLLDEVLEEDDEEELVETDDEDDDVVVELLLELLLDTDEPDIVVPLPVSDPLPVSSDEDDDATTLETRMMRPPASTVGSTMPITVTVFPM